MTDLLLSLPYPDTFTKPYFINPVADSKGTESARAFFQAVTKNPPSVSHPKTIGTLSKIPESLTQHAIVQSKSPVSPTAFELQARLRARWPEIVARAQELEKTIPDPVQALIQLLGNLPGDYASWREIIEEPYG